MSTERLRVQLETARAARVELENQRARAGSLDSDLGRARDALAAAEEKLSRALGAEQLGEALPKQTEPARREQYAAAERVRAITSALAILKEREPDAETTVADHERLAKELARPMATELAAVELARAQRLAAEFGDSLFRWYRLASLADGATPTGDRQLGLHQCHRILYEHHIRCEEGAIHAGDWTGRDGSLTPTELLALLPSEAKAAE